MISIQILHPMLIRFKMAVSGGLLRGSALQVHQQQVMNAYHYPKHRSMCALVPSERKLQVQLCVQHCTLVQQYRYSACPHAKLPCVDLQVQELLSDLQAAYESGQEHFLGAIVTTRQGDSPGEPYWVRPLLELCFAAAVQQVLTVKTYSYALWLSRLYGLRVALASTSLQICIVGA